jgi:hypothetical protein
MVSFTNPGFLVKDFLVVMYSFVPSFREAKFCGVPSCVFDKLGCAAGEKGCGTLILTALAK